MFIRIITYLNNTSSTIPFEIRKVDFIEALDSQQDVRHTNYLS